MAETIAVIEALRARDQLLQQTRMFFQRRGLLEVDTPALQRSGNTDPHIESLAVINTSQSPEYLHTSPEFAMKRLLCHGSGDIYQLAKVWRGAEHGRRHSSEFTMLEWYRVGFSMAQLMDEVAAYLCEAVSLWRAPPNTHFISYAECFLENGLPNPHTASHTELTHAIDKAGVDCMADTLTRDDLLDLCMTHVIEAQLPDDQLTFITHFPRSKAALAECIEVDGIALAERFEVYYQGLELANGYHELLASEAYAERFVQENRQRLDRGQIAMPIDETLLNALSEGMPRCSGVALGIERLLMSGLATKNIREVMPAFNIMA